MEYNSVSKNTDYFQEAQRNKMILMHVALKFKHFLKILHMKHSTLCLLLLESSVIRKLRDTFLTFIRSSFVSGKYRHTELIFLSLYVRGDALFITLKS